MKLGIGWSMGFDVCAATVMRRATDISGIAGQRAKGKEKGVWHCAQA